MTLVLNNAQVFHSGVFSRSSVSISLGNGVSRGGTISTMDASSFVILPGFVDVHVHLREPGFSYKETIRSGSLAAAHGGYTTVCAMPNLNPVPDSMEHLQPELDAIRNSTSSAQAPPSASCPTAPLRRAKKGRSWQIWMPWPLTWWPFPMTARACRTER